MFPWGYADHLLATKSECVGLIVRAISFLDFQPVVIHQRYRRTTCYRKTALCTKVHSLARPPGPSFQLGTLSTRIASGAARSDVDLFIARTGQTD